MNIIRKTNVIESQKCIEKFILLKPSHPKVFSLYNRLGIEIGEYKSIRDNELNEYHSDMGLVDVCGKCLVNVPCATTNPVKIK